MAAVCSPRCSACPRCQKPCANHSMHVGRRRCTYAKRPLTSRLSQRTYVPSHGRAWSQAARTSARTNGFLLLAKFIGVPRGIAISQRFGPNATQCGFALGSGACSPPVVGYATQTGRWDEATPGLNLPLANDVFRRAGRVGDDQVACHPTKVDSAARVPEAVARIPEHLVRFTLLSKGETAAHQRQVVATDVSSGELAPAGCGALDAHSYGLRA
eukprot:scaffold248016_cov30-Tisochrysis_lutea.AAC.1